MEGISAKSPSKEEMPILYKLAHLVGPEVRTIREKSIPSSSLTEHPRLDLSLYDYGLTEP